MAQAHGKWVVLIDKRDTLSRLLLLLQALLEAQSANLRHILTKKSTKRKRHLRGTSAVHQSNMVAVRAMMPYA